jgi:hypothetical protein
MGIRKETFYALTLASLALLGCGRTSRLVSVMNAEFRNAVWTEPSWGISYKGYRLIATDDGKLEVRLYVCGNWMPLADCESKQAWQHGGGRISIAQVDPSSIKVVAAAPDALLAPTEPKPSGFRVDYGCAGEGDCWTDSKNAPSLVCKSATSCESMAGAFRELVTSAGRKT